MAQKKIKKVLIIGSNSFSAGSFINLLLKKKYRVFAISRSKLVLKKFLPFDSNDKNFSFTSLDINKDHKKIISYVKRLKPKYIVNYASQSMVGESWENPIDWYQTNSLGMIKLYNSIANTKLKLKLIHISTPEVYGNIEKITFENSSYNPTTPYAASRVTADHFLNLLFLQKKINYSLVRASNVYGEYQRLYRIIPKTIFSILNQKKLNLHGGGLSKRNFIHIDDVSTATLKIMTKGKSGEAYHVSGDTMVSIKNLVKKICNKMNFKFNNLVNKSKERKGKDKYYFLSSKKIKKELKWKQKISLDTGLDRCITWITKNKIYFKNSDLKYQHKK